MNRNKKVVGENRNIISIQMDANFFYERALRSLDRFHYDKALKYFQRAVDYEPSNPINYCNIAGVLSEIGKYGESNHILQKVIDEIDPNMTECHFYMANNFANMEFFEDAERELIQYLQEDEEGQYLEEAEEMIEFLELELERPTSITKVKARAGVYEHIRARELLEKGQYADAIQLLQTITKENPDFLAARNNLALAYYYVGFKVEGKQAIEEVLEEDPGNLHALCNLALFYHYEGETNALNALLQALKNIDPFYQEHTFKMATTMGILKEHRIALRHFSRLIKEGEAKKDPCVCHFAAVASCNIAKYDEAKKYWDLYKVMDEHSSIPQYFSILLKMIKTDPLKVSLSYSYYATVEEQMTIWEQQSRERGVAIEPQFMKAFFYWALQYGDYAAKLKSIQVMEPYADEHVVTAMKQFLLLPAEDDYLKQITMFVLRSMGINEAFQVMLSGQKVNVEAERIPAMPPLELRYSDLVWEEVAQLAITKTAKHYNVIQQHDMITLWINFLSKSSRTAPKLNKIEAWAAAIEYLTAKMYNRPVTYHDVALRYGTSISTVSKRVKQIDEICEVKSKMKSITSSWFVT
ncbi:tetratricopeptide repeat protein [Paenibacillus endoradicis]|uniref:tetratricopeptide repeat protein n=1 Tax=Paenibacillus endoradicis TaxID=2972487 RepID=UPI0021593E81|nr:tetratricopeptide repeat protein [Paenibacillus endoradicis]MCR8659720.1 tetratricopeptide repeat protein [Paenibacillus endoradicis]